MFTNFKRVLNFAVSDFYRSRGTSVATVFVVSITTLLITGLFFMHGISNFLIVTIQDKIDITAYFKADTKEQDILSVKNELARMSAQVKSVEYVSKEDALAKFSEKHKDSDVLSTALSQVGSNPFLPSLNIVTESGSALQYEEIAAVLQSSQLNDLVDKVDFSQKRDTIEKVFAITSSINRFGIGLSLFLILVAILVVFNTIKLAIEHSKEEISTMRIVGASSWFVQAPFIIQGALFGVISFVFCFVVTALFAYLLSSGMAIIAPGFNLLNYFTSNILVIVGIQLGFGVALGVLSSVVVVNKYLKV